MGVGIFSKLLIWGGCLIMEMGGGTFKNLQSRAPLLFDA